MSGFKKWSYTQNEAREGPQKQGSKPETSEVFLWNTEQ